MSNSRRPLTPEARGRVRRVYLFVVTALAVCMFGLIFLPRPPAPRSDVSVDIEQRLSGRTEKEASDEFDRWVADNANLRRAIEAVSFEGNGSRQSLPLVHASWSFHGEPAPGDASKRLTLAIRCATGQGGLESASDAAALVNQLAQQYVDEETVRHASQAENRCQVAQRAQDVAQARYVDAQGALERFQREVQRMLMLQLAAKPEEPPPTVEPLPPVEQVRPQHRTVANPRWAEVQAELDQLQQQRKTLLVRLTEAHPQVTVLDDEIEQVTRRLEATPRLLVENIPVEHQNIVDTPPKPRHTVPRITPPTEDPVESRRIAVMRTQLQREVDDARRVLDDAQGQAKTAHEALHHARQASPARIATFARAPDPVDSQSSGGMLAGLCCVALLLGSGVYVKGVRVDPTLRSVDDARRTLSVPVVGTLAVDCRADVKPPVAKPPRWTRRLSRGGEVFLSVFALTLLGLATADPPFAARCWADPVGAPSQTVRRVVEVFSPPPASSDQMAKLTDQPVAAGDAPCWIPTDTDETHRAGAGIG